ncbi:unnamed protein product [Chilo suppressalis]|uniref:Alpha-1,3-mannosyl-glycoprotein 4-beta-N-acetylglucosaminyltransferase A n=1 Tax=Chilo suppressalis TaxID=168631 RepID=A0ABN8B6V6_CHISP|nr:unnamed protein product [Chilo suppressalis]
MFKPNEFLHTKFKIRKRVLTLQIFILSVFAVIVFREVRILNDERRELEETKFLCFACSEKNKAVKLNSSLLLQKQQSKWIPSWQLHHPKASWLRSILIALNGTKTVTGLYDLKALNSSNFILPHLKMSEDGLIPAFQMSGGRHLVDTVIGVTTVRRDKADYLIESLKELIHGLTETEKNNTLVVVMVGEIELEYVLSTARNIESKFTKEVRTGLIEVISPSQSYYPIEDITATLGDSLKRTLWRAKHILDCVYVMAYGHTRGSFYLIMEDDVVAKNGYMTKMKQVIEYTSRYKPRWLILDFCQKLNGFGKLLRSSDVGHFMKYLQLFYYNMPLDFLIESYLQDKACGISKKSKGCQDAVNQIRVKSPIYLFSHIGLFSTLKGKIQRVEESRFITGPTYYAYANPPLKRIICNIESMPGHTIQMAYYGKSYFLGVRPDYGSVIEFWFEKPTIIKRYKFQSGNYQHRESIFFNTLVEVQSVSKNFSVVGVFDEFGFTEANLHHFGPLTAIRLRLLNPFRRNIILSEPCFRLSWWQKKYDLRKHNKTIYF